MPSARMSYGDSSCRDLGLFFGNFVSRTIHGAVNATDHPLLSLFIREFLRCFDHSLFHNAQGTMSSREQKDGGCYQKSAPKKGDGIFAEAFKVNEKLRLPTAQISVCLRMDMNLGIVCVCIYLE